MINTLNISIIPNFRLKLTGDGVIKILFLVFVIFWGVMAIHPYDRFDWLLENLLTLIFLGLLVLTFKVFKFSVTAYFLMAIFLSLHTIGAHYSYTTTPLDLIATKLFHFSRDNYDRAVHFSFGLFFAYPIRELLLKAAKVRVGWSYLLPVIIVLGTGAFYELIEMWVALIVAPDLGQLFLGTQGDVWDSQHDMEVSLYGAAIAMILNAAINKILSVKTSKADLPSPPQASITL